MNRAHRRSKLKEQRRKKKEDAKFRKIHSEFLQMFYNTMKRIIN